MTVLSCLLTPPGRGAIAVIHVAGAGAVRLVGKLFPAEIGPHPRPGILASGSEALDEVMVRTAPGFTGEETIEITCHGGRATVERLLSALETLGARRTEAAGLLERGIATGHLDRLRAEAWERLPAAATARAARVLRDQAEGALSSAVAAMRSPADARRLLGTAPLGLALASPRRVVIAGRPNAGKSTLFNALAGRDRVVVSDVPGTTRDPVRELVAIGGVPFELVDTAGVETPRDALEGRAMDRTRSALSDADLVVYLFDAAAGPQPDERDPPEGALAVRNKVDAGDRGPDRALPVSARTGTGLDALRRAILEAFRLPEVADGAPVVFTDRQVRLLEDAAGGRLEPAAAVRGLLQSPSTSA